MKIIISLLAIGLLTGCGSTQSIGKIGNTEFFAVKSRSLQGPNFTALVTKEGDNVIIRETIGGPGIGQSVVTAGGQIGSAAVLRPARTQVQTSVGSVSASGSGGSGSTTTSASADTQNGSIHHNH